MSTTRAIQQAHRQALAYQTFRRGLRRLEDAKATILQAIAMLERPDHPLGAIDFDSEVVNETTAERLGLSAALVEKALAERAA